MSRRTLLLALTGLVLVAGSGGSALAAEAGLLGTDDGRTTLCLRTDGPDSPRPEGLCVWVPVEP